MMMPRLMFVLCVFFLSVSTIVGAPSAASAGELAKPTGTVLLTVSGDIANTNGDGVARFDFAMLKALGMDKTVTETPWTDGTVTFDGVLARKVMAAVGAKGTTAAATAVNDYAVKIPLTDFTQFPVILAYSLNGKRIRLRDKGPLWVIYPWSATPELNRKLYFSRSIWQLDRIVIE